MASDLSLPRKIGLGLVFARLLVDGLRHFQATGFCVAIVPPSVSL